MSSNSDEPRRTPTMRDGLLCRAEAALDSFCGDADAVTDELEIALPDDLKTEEEEEDDMEAMAETERAQNDPVGIIGKDPWCTLSSYGGASSFCEKELEHLIGPDEDGGLVWTAKLLPNDAPIKTRLKARITRRGVHFPVATEDFLSSVKRIGTPAVEAQAEAGYDDLWDRNQRGELEDEHVPEARWIFKGVLNGWPGLTLLEVKRVRAQEQHSLLKKLWKGATNSSSNGNAKTIWDAFDDGNVKGVELADAINKYAKGKSDKIEILIELRAPTWSSHGWSKHSPGFIFWTEGPTINDPTPSNLKLTYGTDIKTNTMEKDYDPACTMIHMINHRYASPKKAESAKDRILYHSLALLEWDHQKYSTVVEIGFLNGLGGYKGKSNWFEDKNATPYSQMYAAFPSEMVLPWKKTNSEIRVTNVPYRNKDELINNFMKKYEGHQGRFVDINCSFSHEVRLTYNTRSNIATYLVNYILRDKTYNEMKRNCQTFAADLCGFLAGKKDVSPYHPVSQIQYQNKNHTFLYESSKYSTKKRNKAKRL
ncbi:hypothetical protein ACHAXR_001902, partial [Thalassiosira sp. AJA248-18]